ncbi:acetylcholine receptor subunit alpha-like isoform X1 [Haliotis cracherodii]|uniref:acetylcholine receptor subunit alpha-like isoform X1 n=2 Tax=Haliotis cracherodii TaxID=6455 RepID=UPI0039E8FD40
MARSLLVLVMLLCVSTEVTPYTSADIKNLVKTIFADYDVLVRPIYNQSIPTKINVVFWMKQLEFLDMKKQAMKSLGHFSINWTDEFLQWNPADHNGLKYITVPENRIWKPDYVINNDITSKRKMGDGSSLVVIESNGRVLWEPGFIATTVCGVDIKYFPFDIQKCPVNITSWMTSNISQRSYSTRGISFDSFTENGEFEIKDFWVQHTLFPMTYIKNEMLEGLAFFVVLKRRTTFYWLCLVSPVLAFPLLSPLSFLVPADSGEKTTLAITSLLSIFVFMSSIYETLPKLSNHVSLFVLLTSVQVFVSLLTVVCNVIILCLHRLTSRHKIPKWLNIIVQRDKPTFTYLNCEDTAPETRKISDSADTTWAMVAAFLGKICLGFSLVCTTMITIVFGALMIYH